MNNEEQSNSYSVITESQACLGHAKKKSHPTGVHMPQKEEQKKTKQNKISEQKIGWKVQKQQRNTVSISGTQF